jgi:uncharacterized surface protein with fasciclin (FAS1) repeats
MLKTLPLCLCAAAALALGGCGDGSDANKAATGPAASDAGGQTIAQTLDQNGKFFQAAKAVGLDSTLAGTGPYTVLVPSDDAFAKLQAGALADPANPQNRAEITRVLTYHILPGVILSDDIGKAIDNGDGKALLATMGGETVTATKSGDTIIVSDGSGGKATITKADIKASNGVIHDVDAVLTPPKAATGAAQETNSAG